MPPILPVMLIAFQMLMAPAIALTRGGRPEKYLAAAYWLDTLASLLVLGFRTVRYHQTEWAVAGIDVLMLGAAVVITVRANRWWPIWFTAIHLIGLIAHLARMIDTSIAPIAYQSVAAYVAYPLWALIIAGTIGHELRLRQYGSDPDWKPSSRPLTRQVHLSGRMRS
jgi:hypothetical protein